MCELALRLLRCILARPQPVNLFPTPVCSLGNRIVFSCRYLTTGLELLKAREQHFSHKAGAQRWPLLVLAWHSRNARADGSDSPGLSLGLSVAAAALAVTSVLQTGAGGAGKNGANHICPLLSEFQMLSVEVSLVRRGSAQLLGKLEGGSLDCHHWLIHPFPGAGALVP